MLLPTRINTRYLLDIAKYIYIWYERWNEMISKAHYTLEFNIRDIAEIVRVILAFLGKDSMCPGNCRYDIEEHICSMSQQESTAGVK